MLRCSAPNCRCISPCEEDPPEPQGPPEPDRNAIRALRHEAAVHGDIEMVQICEAALNGSEDDRWYIAMALEEAACRASGSLWE